MKSALVAIGFFACSPEPSSTVVEIVPPALPSPPPQTAASLPPIAAPARRACEPPPSLAGCQEVERVRVGRVEMSSPSCSIDARVHEGDVGSVLRCGTDGVVRLRGTIFAGSFPNDVISTCTKTKFQFAGCTWESTQRIDGAGRSIVFTYAERPISGDDCSGNPCSAQAELEVIRP